MGKSQQHRWFTTEEGKRARFKQIAFKTAVDQQVEAYKHNNSKRGSLTTVLKAIYQELYQQPDVEPLADQLQLIKNWYYGYNGPSNLEDIYRLAEILECDRKDQFLIIEKEKERKQMNPVQETERKLSYITETPTMAQEKMVLVEAMNRVKEKEIAHELYSFFVDTISKYNVEEEKAFIEAEPGSAEWAEAINRHPKRYPIYLAIRKASIYLPEELLNEARALVEYMYGTDYFSEWEDPNPKCIADSFAVHKYSQLHEYLKQEKEEHDLSNEDERIEAWVDFLHEQSYHLYDLLDDIFCDYLKG